MSLEKIRHSDCADCTLGDYCRGVDLPVCIMGQGDPKAKLMIIAEAPDREDAANETVMRSQYNSYLLRVLKEGLSVEPEQVYITYLVKCKPDGHTKADVAAKACFKYLEQEIQAIKPAVILTMGDTVTKNVYGASNIMRLRGNMYLKEIAGINVKIIPTFSIGYIMKVQAQFKNWAQDIAKAWEEAYGLRKEQRKSAHKIVTTMEEVEQVIEYIKQTKEVCLDFETYNLERNLETNKATGLAFSFQPGSAYFIPLFHFESPFTEEQAFHILDRIRVEIMENPAIRKIGHNLKFDLHIANMYGITKVRGRLDDTMLMSHLVDETTPNGLKENIRMYFPMYGDYEQDIAGMKWDKIPLKPLAEYCCIDADLTHRLCIFLESILTQDARLYRVYRSEVMAAFRVLMKAERVGMLIDRDFLTAAIRETEEMIERQNIKLRSYPQVINFESEVNTLMSNARIAKLEAQIDKFTETRLTRKTEKARNHMTATEQKAREAVRGLKAGTMRCYEGINFGSPKQLSDLLFTIEGFAFEAPIDRKTGNYQVSTGKEVLIDIEDETGFIEDLQIWRSLEKMLSTYLLGIYNRLDGDNRLHTSFLQHGTVSGRLSSRDPNLQNLPNIAKLKNLDVIKTVEYVKKSFIVPEGYTLIAMDYSQAELRVIADFAQEPTMLKAYNDGLDLHAITGARMKGLSLEDFFNLPEKEKKEARTRAKAGNFGLIYDMSAAGFKDYAKNNYGVEITLREAEKIRDDFFNLYSALPNYHALYIAKGQQYGYVRTLFGRKRHVPNIHSSDSFKRSLDERVCINSPIQGTAGEFTIFASAVSEHRLDPRVIFVLNVHDANYYYAPDALVAESVDILQKTAENLPVLQYFEKELQSIGMKVDIETSKTNMKDTEPYEKK